MNRVREFFYWLGFVLLVLPAVCGKVAKGQQGKPPVVRGFWTASDIRYDPTLPWISEYRQPPIYKEWWREIAECEGLPVPPDSLTSRVQFFQINARDFMPDNVRMVALAMTSAEHGQIYMGVPYVWRKEMIQHEMAHMILYWLGYRMGNYHPPEVFERCGLRIGGMQ